MISRTIRLYPTKEQAARLDEWFWIGTGVWNWALNQIESTRNEVGLRRARYEGLTKAVRGHATRVGMQVHVMHGILRDVSRAEERFRERIAGPPRRKGVRNRLASLPFRSNGRERTFRLDGRTLRLPMIGDVRRGGIRGLPIAIVRTARIHRRPRGWYATVTLDAEPKAIPLTGDRAVGIDLGYSTLATLSTGEKIEHPDEYRRLETRLGQVQRGRSKRRSGRLMQSVALAQRTRNHRISRDLVSRFGAIYVSKDNVKSFQRRWGKSVLNAGHSQLRAMLATKSRQAGRVYLEVNNRNSTRMCSSCGALNGPSGLHGLSVREWACACGARWDRDVNAAINTLKLGAVLAHEMAREGQSEISDHC